MYVDDERPGPMSGARPGDLIVKRPFTPPWLVVDHDLGNVLVTRWPGRLFAVTVAAPESRSEREATEAVGARFKPGGRFTPTFRVRVDRELPVASLFGAAGERVVEVIEAGRGLDAEAAGVLAEAVDPGARDEQAAAWERWLGEQPHGHPYRGDGGILAVPGAGPVGSPIGAGFGVIHHVVRRAALRDGGPGAVEVDEDGDECLAEPWAGAMSALLQAAMALGAARFVERPDVLSRAWSALEGHMKRRRAR